MPQRDSVDKIVQSYFAAVATEPFTYKKKTYNPKLLQVSAGIFNRRMTCVAECGACCPRFSLDWLPSEPLPDTEVDVVERRIVDVNGVERPVWTDWQRGNDEHHCHNLGDHALCLIHESNPFSCNFETLRFSHFTQPHRNNILNNRPFGRAWQMMKQDGERGAICEWNDTTDAQMLDWKRSIVRRLIRLEGWCNHWALPNCVNEITEWVKSGPHPKPLVTGNEYVAIVS